MLSACETEQKPIHDRMPSVVHYPRPLTAGSLVVVTAPSAGVRPALHPRLDLVLAQLRAAGFRVREGDCLRNEHKHASAPRQARAGEFMAALMDDAVDAVLPPCDGERAIELLDLLDFDALARVRPKWLMGYSDLSTLMLPLSLRCNWATVHGPSLMDLAPGQQDALTVRALLPLMLPTGATFQQAQSVRWQRQPDDFEINPHATHRLTEPTRWRLLDASHGGTVSFSGRLIGGCVDALMHLVGSSYADVPDFITRCDEDGTVLYLENAELSPPALLRALWSLRLAGWFSNLRGVLIGRSTAPDPSDPAELGATDALQAVLSELPCPVLYDVDIGHRPPQFALVNGARAEVRWSGAQGGQLSQELD